MGKSLVLYEDDYLLAVQKLPGLAAVPAEGIPREQTILGRIAKELTLQNADYIPYVLHRLDLKTSGVMLLGKYPRDRSALEDIFRKEDTSKQYLALVKGTPRTGHITTKLAARTSDIKIDATTNIAVRSSFLALETKFSLLEIRIKTGRKHQIRQHLSQIGHPVVLDQQYGNFELNRIFKNTFGLRRQFLHAESITFFHPFLKKSCSIIAPLTTDLARTLDVLSTTGKTK